MTAPTALSVFVAGRPAPQGSKRGFSRPGTGKVTMVESSKAVKPWREDVRAALLDEHGQPRQRFEGAVVVVLDFVMPRPVSTPKRRTPPAMRKPDLDKLVRACFDAITSAGVIIDDARVVRLAATKVLAEPDWVSPTVRVHAPAPVARPYPAPATVDVTALEGLVLEDLATADAVRLGGVPAKRAAQNLAAGMAGLRERWLGRALDWVLGGGR